MKQKKFNITNSFTLIFLAITSPLYFGGCIIPMYIPLPEHGYSHMQAVNHEMVKGLEPGTTTKEDVGLLLGGQVTSADRFYCHYWTRIDGYWGLALVVPGGGDMIEDWQPTEDVHAFCFEFLTNSKLKRFKHFETSMFKKGMEERINDWKRKED